jgi:tight adherence protein B
MFWVLLTITSLITGITASLLALRFGDRVIWTIRLRIASDTRRLSVWGDSLYLSQPAGDYRRQAILILLSGLIIPILCLITTGRPILAGATAAAIWFGQYQVYQILRARIIDVIEESLPGAVESMVSSLRAGRSLLQSIIDVSSRLTCPLGREFVLIAEEQSKGGLSLADSLKRAGKRIGSDNFTMVSSAIIISLSQGGDILSILERNAESLRELLKLRKKIRTETAQVRMQEKIIILMTPLFLGLVCSFDDEIPVILFDTILGNILLAVVGSIQLFSILWIRRILRATI